MGHTQINVKTQPCSRTFIARSKQAALTHTVSEKELIPQNLCKIHVLLFNAMFI